ncbi:MAG TPA: hypothetical protein VHC47_01510, partial [Mucilaginibacter sp.]|nr:hypothetical protein [Mucilaginibacter sp.]
MTFSSGIFIKKTGSKTKIKLKMKKSIHAFFIGVLIISSCAKDGAVGPAGPQGPVGPAGPAGSNGQ